MAVKSITFQVALMVIIIVGLLIVIHSAWTLGQLNRIVGDDCPCSGVDDHELNHSRTFSTVMLLAGIGIMIYAVIMLLVPTSVKRDNLRAATRERFLMKSD